MAFFFPAPQRTDASYSVFTSGSVTQRLFPLCTVQRQRSLSFVCVQISEPGLSSPQAQSNPQKTRKKGNLSNQSTALLEEERTYDIPEYLRDLEFCVTVVPKVLPSLSSCCCTFWASVFTEMTASSYCNSELMSGLKKKN